MFERVRFLPVMIAILVTFLGLKGMDMWLGVGIDVSAISEAEASGSEHATADVHAPPSAQATHIADSEQDVTSEAPGNNEYLSAADVDILNSMEERDAKYEAWEQDLKVREAMLNVAEKKVEAKIAELRDLESTLRQLVGEQSAKEEADLLRLVKVYENMKAKAAAPILERLDLETQVSIASRMKEVKLAAILPYMSKSAAQVLTTELMRNSEMPAQFQAADVQPEL